MIKDVIYADDCRESMVDAFRNGYEKAETTYFTKLNEGYRWLKKDVTLMAGVGNHGKSTFYIQLAVLRAKYNKEKFAIFSPEQYPADYFYNDIIHTLTGCYPSKKYMNEDIYFQSMRWVNDHFFYVYPEDENPTPDYINERFELLINEHGIAGVCIDPFNQLVNDWETSGRDDRYISAFLQKCKRFANLNNVYYHVIVHPKGTIGLDGADLRCPHVFDLAGGAMWNNHADNILFIHKPYSITDPKSTEVIVRVAKIKKQKIVGIPGDYNLNFERNKNRYFDQIGSPFDDNYGVINDSDLFHESKKDSDAVPF